MDEIFLNGISKCGFEAKMIRFTIAGSRVVETSNLFFVKYVTETVRKCTSHVQPSLRKLREPISGDFFSFANSSMPCTYRFFLLQLQFAKASTAIFQTNLFTATDILIKLPPVPTQKNVVKTDMATVASTNLYFKVRPVVQGQLQGGEGGAGLFEFVDSYASPIPSVILAKLKPEYY